MSVDFSADRSATPPPSRGEFLADRLFRSLTYTAGALVVILLLYILYKIGMQRHRRWAATASAS